MWLNRGISVIVSKKILLVEDQDSIAFEEAKMFRTAGYSVEIARSGETAVEAIERDGNIDLILMDIDLGAGMSGPDAARRILAHRNLPIVYLSSHTDQATVEMLKGATRHGFVEKGSGDFALLACIETAFELFEAQQAVGGMNVEDELDYFHIILSTIPSLVILTGSDSESPIYVSANSLRVTGYTPGELMSGFHEFAHEDDQESLKAAIRDAFQTRKNGDNFEFKAKRKDGSVWHASASWRSIRDDSGAYKGRVFQIHDITERKLAEARVQQLLVEKEILLKEVHHRIKNNMSILSSMLSIQSGMISDVSTSSILDDMRGRIAGMVNLYDALYRSDGFKSLSTNAYLTVILQGIVAQFAGSSEVALTWDIIDRDMDSLLLFPLGIIMNELVTNAFKYAFPNGGAGHISVSLSGLEPCSFELLVADDGIGMVGDAQAGRSGGFGSLLVETLAQQIDGVMERKSAIGEGTEFRMRFSIREDALD